jgi:hypothetical protein
MDFHVVVMFIDSFMNDFTYVRDVAVCMWITICNVLGCICYGSKNFGFGSLHDEYVGISFRVNPKKKSYTKYCIVFFSLRFFVTTR